MKFPNTILILDIDSTLVYTREDYEHIKHTGLFNSSDLALKNNIYYINFKDGKYDTYMWGIYRNGVADFLRYAKANFAKVGIWSAGAKDYVEAIADLLVNKAMLPTKFDFIWTRNDCKSNRDTNYLVVKDIERFKNKMGYDNYNAIIIDDTPSTFSENVESAIHIPRFKIDHRFINKFNNDINSDTALYRIMDSFNKTNKRYPPSGPNAGIFDSFELIEK